MTAQIQSAPVVDGRQPREVVRAESADELAEWLGGASREGLAVIPIGGGRALGMGNPPLRYDVALDLRSLDTVLEHSRHDLTVTVEAGVTLENLQQQLLDAGQFLPLDPFSSPGHTIGGLLASGWSGPLRLRYGSPRDYLIGLRVALADGRLVRSGGKVVKNVSGYDLNKLHYGALGSLGVIVEASFKVFPQPLADASSQFTTSDLQVAWREAKRTLELAQLPVALTLERGAGGEVVVTARFHGSQGAVRRMTDELGWTDASAHEWEELAARGWSARAAVPPGSLEALTTAVTGEFCALPGVGSVYLRERDAETLRLLRGRALELEGSLVLLDADIELKQAVGAWGPPPAGIGIMKAIKEAFDPRHSLSPGRYVV